MIRPLYASVSFRCKVVGARLALRGDKSAIPQKNEEKLIQDGAAAYFEKSALDLDKNSDRLAATVETVLCRLNRPVHKF